MCKLLMIRKDYQGWKDRIWVGLLLTMHRASAWDEGEILQKDHGKGCAALQ